ncbi:glycosyltransferase family 4 protein [Kribbella sp. NPDC059898]|uniref:glycosyltransferase family 4 protein n=1 Tax=Kribbella sp. NPDC059898 TaxID=3346995 RepID=UPI00365CD83C
MRSLTVAVLMHDGFYGCGTGAGQSNRALLGQLIEQLPPATDFLVMPVRLDPTSSEYDRQWHMATKALLEDARPHGSRCAVVPLENGTDGQVRFAGIPSFDHVAQDAARHLRTRFANIAGGPRPWIVALDVPFFGLGSALDTDLTGRLVLVPRSSAKLHTPDDAKRIAWETRALTSATGRGARVAAISAHMRQHLQSDYLVDPKQIIDLPNGLVDADWRPPLDGPMQPPGHGAAGFVLSMGRATPYKGFDDLLDALNILREQHVSVPHTVLAAVTDGLEVSSYQRHLQRRILDEGLDVSLLTTFSPAVRSLLWHPALNVVVVPSRTEPFGRIPLEAHAAGASPVVTTTAGGLVDQVADGLTGYTCAPADPVSLASALRRAVNTGPADRALMRDRAQADARRRFDHSAAVRAFVARLVDEVD